MNMTGKSTGLAIGLILFCVVLTSVSQILLKKGMSPHGEMFFGGSILQQYARVLLTPEVIVGMVIYLVASFLYVYALSKVSLSYAYPFVALSYLFVTAGSRWFLSEQVSMVRWLGIGVICIGVMIVSRS